MECTNIQCSSFCENMSGYTSVDQYYLDIAVPKSQSSVTLESLLYNTFFSNMNQKSERLKCESCNNAEAHKVRVCRNAPPVLIIHLSQNSDGKSPCSTPIFVPSVLYYDNFFVTPGKGKSYSLVSIIYCYGVSIDVGYYNCTLFNRDDKCITFDDASITEKLSHDKLVNVNEQKYVQIFFCVRDASPYQQRFTNDSEKPWAESEDIIKTAERLIIAEIECSKNIGRKDIFHLITGKAFTGGIINSFPNTLKLNDSDIEVICPLFFRSLNNEERITDSVKYVINTRRLMDKTYIFFPLNLHGIHWALVIIMPQTSALLYFDSVLTPSNFTNQLNLITSFFNFYCVVYKVQQIHWDYVICGEAYQQKNDKDCGMFCCLNAYYFLNGYVYYEEEDSLAVRYWIAYQYTKFNFTFARIAKVIDFEEKASLGI